MQGGRRLRRGVESLSPRSHSWGGQTPLTPEVRVRLQHILEAVGRIQEYTRGGKGAFFKTPMIQDAVARNLEIIGEAVRAIPDSYRQGHPNLPWRRMVGLRNVLIHEYFGVDQKIVWTVTRRRLPGLKRAILGMGVMRIPRRVS